MGSFDDNFVPGTDDFKQRLKIPVWVTIGIISFHDEVTDR